jgi:hypothetical protein
MDLPSGVQPRPAEEIDKVLRDQRKEMRKGSTQAAAGAARVAGRPLPAGTIVHEVGPRDTLTSLAVRYVPPLAVLVFSTASWGMRRREREGGDSAYVVVLARS